MARWKLTEGHYLYTNPPTKWEYTEIDRGTGRPMRHQYDVPMHLEPKFESDWNYRPNPNVDGDIVVSNGSNSGPMHGLSREIVFIGDPTPGMLPLDDDAREITAACSKGVWRPTAGLDPESQAESYTGQLLSGLIDRMTEMKTQEQNAAPNAEMVKMMAAMTQMMQQQTDILAKLAAPSERRRAM